MPQPDGAELAANLFQALSSPTRVSLVLALQSPHTVTELVALTGVSQPLVSQHLRVLRTAGLVTVERSGRESTYRVSDSHVSHVVQDAVTHVLEESV